MSARSFARLLVSVRALPPRVGLFQVRAMLRARRLRDDFALVSSTRPAEVAELIRLARGRRAVVELGTATGWTTGSLLLADRQRRLTSFDPFVNVNREAYLSLLPRSSRSRLQLVEAPGQAAEGNGVEFLFVDSSHDRDATIAEVQAWRPRLAPGALVVLHDYSNPAWPGVAEAIEALGLDGREQRGMWVWRAPSGPD